MKTKPCCCAPEPGRFRTRSWNRLCDRDPNILQHWAVPPSDRGHSGLFRGEGYAPLIGSRLTPKRHVHGPYNYPRARCCVTPEMRADFSSRGGAQRAAPRGTTGEAAGLSPNAVHQLARRCNATPPVAPARRQRGRVGQAPSSSRKSAMFRIVTVAAGVLCVTAGAAGAATYTSPVESTGPFGTDAPGGTAFRRAASASTGRTWSSGGLRRSPACPWRTSRLRAAVRSRSASTRRRSRSTAPW